MVGTLAGSAYFCDLPCYRSDHLENCRIGFNLPFIFAWGSLGIILTEFLKRNYPIDKMVFYSVIAILAMGLFFFCLTVSELEKIPGPL